MCRVFLFELVSLMKSLLCHKDLLPTGDHRQNYSTETCTCLCFGNSAVLVKGSTGPPSCHLDRRDLTLL